jgi:hypothetical protein
MRPSNLGSGKTNNMITDARVAREKFAGIVLDQKSSRTI